MTRTNPDGRTRPRTMHAHTPSQKGNSYVSLYCKRARQKEIIFSLYSRAISKVRLYSYSIHIVGYSNIQSVIVAKSTLL